MEESTREADEAVRCSPAPPPKTRTLLVPGRSVAWDPAPPRPRAEEQRGTGRETGEGEVGVEKAEAEEPIATGAEAKELRLRS